MLTKMCINSNNVNTLTPTKLCNYHKKNSLIFISNNVKVHLQSFILYQQINHYIKGMKIEFFSF